GAMLSGAAGYIGMNVSVRANVRTAEAARQGLSAAMNVAFRGGAITGMLVVGLALLGVAGYWLILNRMGITSEAALHALVGLAFGSSLISIFARLGGVTLSNAGADAVLYPLLLGAVSIIASIIGTLFVRVGAGGSIMGALYKGVIVSAVLAAIAFYPITMRLMASFDGGALNLWFCSLIGLALTGAIVWITEYYTGTD